MATKKMSVRQKANSWLEARFGDLVADANSWKIDDTWSVQDIFDMLDTISDNAQDIRDEIEEAGLTEKGLAKQYDKDEKERIESNRRYEQQRKEWLAKQAEQDKAQAKSKAKAKAKA